MREWITNITLKKNGPDTPPQSEMYCIIDILACKHRWEGYLRQLQLVFLNRNSL